VTGDTVRLTVPSEAEGLRLDRYLAAALSSHTRSALRRLIVEGRVRIEGRRAAKAGVPLEAGMHLEVDLPAPPSDALEGEDLPFGVLHEDDSIVVVDKPPGLVVHPGHGRRHGTLVHGLLGRGVPLAPAGGRDRPGIVHRLDRDTSGVLVVAKTDDAHRALSRAFAHRAVGKTYVALVWGHPRPGAGRIEARIGRSRSDPTRMSVHSGKTRHALTTYRTLEAPAGFALLEVGIETGRTHQIRVHLQSIHHPVVGDTRYGGDASASIRDPQKRKALRAFGRLALHAWRLELDHPATGERVRYESPLPRDFADLLAALRAPA
jgi:23S rRNA pseudouridine1911/1915/1917 synthase